MHKKVMLEFPDGKRRWGYATTTSSQSSYGAPVIACGDNIYKSGDITASGIIIICNDHGVVAELKKAGYNPVSRNTSTVERAMVSMPLDLYKKIKSDAENNSMTISNMIVEILRKHYGKD